MSDHDRIIRFPTSVEGNEKCAQDAGLGTPDQGVVSTGSCVQHEHNKELQMNARRQQR